MDVGKAHRETLPDERRTNLTEPGGCSNHCWPPAICHGAIFPFVSTCFFAKPIPSPVPSAWTSEPPTSPSAFQAFPPQGSQCHPFYNKLDKVSLLAQSFLALYGSGVPTGLPSPRPYYMELSCSTLTPLLTPSPGLPVNTPLLVLWAISSPPPPSAQIYAPIRYSLHPGACLDNRDSSLRPGAQFSE